MFSRTKETKYKDEQPRVTSQGDAVLLKVPKANTTKFMNAPAYKGSTDVEPAASGCQTGRVKICNKIPT